MQRYSREDTLKEVIQAIERDIEGIIHHEAEWGREGFLMSSEATKRIKHYKEVIKMLEGM